MMADPQKIHPVDIEAAQQRPRPSVPLVPRGSTRSEKGDPENYNYPPPPPPPFRRTIPVSHSKPPPKSRGRCCCRCICWSLCFLLVLIVAVAATLGALYLIYKPKIPQYSVDRLSITAFNVDPDLIVAASFDVVITATNPNDKIGIYYEDGSHLSVWYTGTSLCEGKLPAFYQGHKNTTVLTVVLSGRTQMGSEVMTSLRQAQQTGAVPLDFRGEVPVRVKLGGLKLWKVKFLVTCNIVVNNLSANNQISIRSSSCKFKLRL